MVTNWTSKSGFFSNRFAASVNHLMANGRVFRPARHQAPAEIPNKSVSISILTNCKDLLRGGDVVTGHEFRNFGDSEKIPDRIRIYGHNESAAHIFIFQNKRPGEAEGDAAPGQEGLCCPSAENNPRFALHRQEMFEFPQVPTLMLTIRIL